MEKEKSLVPISLDIEPGEARERLKKINDFQAVVRNTLKEGHDFGVIPGTDKPTLLKPGAEKIAKLLGLADTYEIVSSIEDWEKGFFYYLVKCNLVSLQTGVVVSSGLGSCNSKESKYRYRWVFESEIPADIDKNTLISKIKTSKSGKKYKLYRLENDDTFSIVNTILKMAKKRALVDAALSAGRLSDLFTQDLEDIEDIEVLEEEKEPPENQEKQPEEPGEKEAGGPEKSTAIQKNYKKIKLQLSQGVWKEMDRFEALNYFQTIKEKFVELTGDDKAYYEVLGEHGYEKSNQIPLEEMPKIYEAMRRKYGEIFKAKIKK